MQDPKGRSLGDQGLSPQSSPGESLQSCTYSRSSNSAGVLPFSSQNGRNLEQLDDLLNLFLGGPPQLSANHTFGPEAERARVVAGTVFAAFKGPAQATNFKGTQQGPVPRQKPTRNQTETSSTTIQFGW